MTGRTLSREHWAGLLIGVLLTGVAVLVSYQLALRVLQDRALRIAQGIVLRSEEISLQVDRAMEILDAEEVRGPCTSDHILRMRRVAMSNTRLQLVGYVRQDHLYCSSYGIHEPPIPLGPPTYFSSLGYEVRVGRRLPMAEGASFLLSTFARTGYTVAVLPQLTADFMSERPAIGIGLYSTSSRKPIYHQGLLREPWLQYLNGLPVSVTVVDGEQLVAVVRSKSYDYSAYVALSLKELHPDWLNYAALLVPLAMLLAALVSLLLSAIARNRRSLDAQLSRALQHRTGLTLHYQPIVELGTGRWVGAEALLRWRRPDGGHVSPDVFVPLAENTGQIRLLTRRMLELLSHDLQRLCVAMPGFYVSINLSSQDLVDDVAVADVQALIERFAIQPEQIRVELTERTVIHTDAAQTHLRRLRALGVRVAIDDFGTGYCGLAYLTSLEVDALKIDKVFIDTIGTDAATSQVVGHIIAIGKSLNLTLIAEGVETGQQADHLRSQGVKLAQGWFYAPAMAVDELCDAVQRQQGLVTTL